MAEHHSTSQISVNITSGDTATVGGSVQNKPEMPDVEGRQDIPEGLIPERSDKLVTGLSFAIAADPGVATDLPVIVFGESGELTKRNYGRPATVGETNGNGWYDIGDEVYRFFPDVLGSDPVGIAHHVDIHDPITWPEDDNLFVAARWNDVDHGGIKILCNLHWTEA